MTTNDLDELDTWLEQAEGRLHEAADDLRQAARRAQVLATLAFAGLVGLALLGVHPAAFAHLKNHHAATLPTAATRPPSPQIRSQEGSRPPPAPRSEGHDTSGTATSRATL